MKQFELVISKKNSSGSISFYERIEADDMRILLAHFVLIVAKMMNVEIDEIHEEFLKENDIPF